MKKKGFTLVELLVVIAIIALLMGILMPALARVRQIAYRLYCGTNLSGIGKAMLIYSNDYDDELPRAGLPGSTWTASLANWVAPNHAAAFSSGATYTSCFYLLIKYAEVTPKSFLCKGDSGVAEFKISDPHHSAGLGRELVDLWDFGPSETQQHCSYAYHTPFGTFALTSSSDPGMAIASDPNPWLASCETPARTTWGTFLPTGDRESIKRGNAVTHQDDGQNTLFVDGHTTFEKTSFGGVDDDNFFTRWTTVDSATAEKRKGQATTGPDILPMHRNDSLLLTDNMAGGKTRCFPAETIVWVDGEMTEISKVSAGSMVDKPAVTQTIAGMRKPVCDHEIEGVDVHDECRTWDRYDITLENGNSLAVADSHYFLLYSGKWLSVENLASGSELATLEGSVTIKKVEKSTSSGAVYNLRIKDGQRYLVGKDGIIVRDW
ncbi:MAG: prepilin-type N-terminal cleavage/methylation domain-containing protein [Planctomycetes bacterium]|nr:prepilin-type N-terminal cleavage/methylation domain-containing protein [Planctomycetota bacterium]